MFQHVSPYRVITAASLVLVIGLALYPLGGNAQTGFTLLTSFIEKRVDPGFSLVETIQVRNDFNEPQVFYVAARDIESMDEDGRPIFVPGDQEVSEGQLSRWVSFSPSVIQVAPGSTGSVTVTVRVPENAPHGGHFAAVTFSVDPPEPSSDESALAVGYATGVIFSLRVGEDATDDALLREFRAERGVTGTGSATFHTRIESTGTALIRPYGTIEVSDMFGRFVSSVSFNDTLGAILPGAVRRFETPWEAEGFLFGRYNADLIVTYGAEEKKSLIGSTKFWVLPLKPLLAVLGGIAVLFLAVWASMKAYIRRRLREAGVQPGGGSLGAPASFVAVLVSALVIAAILVSLAFLFLA